jgi:FxsC-like protein
VHGVHVPGGADSEDYRGRAAEEDGPFFFLSYAHGPRDDPLRRDPDLWISQLYDDLCEHIKSLGDLAPGNRAGFMDRELQQGHDWPRRLSVALATCRVFVPLYSRAYFKSEQCGKEWFAFNLRRLNYRARIVRPVETIVPALWVPVRNGQLPEAASSVQYNSADFGELYAEHGFYGIMKVGRWREAYEMAVYLLARRIVEAADASPPAGPEFWGQYQSLPSAFGGNDGTAQGDKLLRVTVVAPGSDDLPRGRDLAYYGEEVREWNPYREDSVRSLADYAAELATSLSYTPDVGDLYRHEAALLGGDLPSGPEVLLIDPWAVLNPECRDMLRRLDALDNPWVQVVVVWNQQDAQMQVDGQQIRAALEGALPRKLREGRATSALAVRGVPSLEDFSVVLPTVIAAASRHYLRTVSARLPNTGRGGMRFPDQGDISDTPGAPLWLMTWSAKARLSRFTRLRVARAARWPWPTWRGSWPATG